MVTTSDLIPRAMPNTGRSGVRARARVIGAVIVAASLAIPITAFAAPITASAAVQPLPGGKQYFSVSLTSIPACSPSPCTGASPYWVRLANYNFNSATGTVAESFWFWTQTVQTKAANTGRTTAGCSLTCNVHAAFGFEDHSRTTARPYPKDLSGSYSVSGSTVTIVWSNGSTEKWTVSNPIATLAQLTFVSSSYGVRTGYGWGSNANPNTSGKSMSNVNATGKNFVGQYVQSDGGTAATSNSSGTTSLIFSSQAWVTCGTNCVQLQQQTATVCSGMPTVYQIAGLAANLRKNSYEHHCGPTFHCPNPPINVLCACGSGGNQHPHLKSMWQVIDDNGTMRGWVVAEASLFEASQGSNYMGAAYYVNLN